MPKPYGRHCACAALLVFSAATVIPVPASAADFAASGAPGTLSFKVDVVGGARKQAGPRAGLDAREWKIRNTGQITIRMRATGAVGDGSPAIQSAGEATRDIYQQTVTDNDQAVLDQWDAKIDACKGNETCESRVQGQMISDPRYQRIMQKMQGAGAAMAEAARGVDVGARQQFWTIDPSDPSAASGNVQLDLTENAYGVVDPAGGGKVDTSCRWTGTGTITPGSTESRASASLRVNAKTSSYEIHIPADAFGLRLAEACSDSKAGAHKPGKNKKYVPLIGRAPPRGVKSFTELLTFKGKIGATASPQLRGRQTVTTEWVDAANPVPVTITIDWQFSAGR